MEEEKKILIGSIKYEENLRNFILSLMQKFGESTDVVELDSVDSTLKVLKNLKKSLSMCNKNIIAMKTILENIDSLTHSCDKVVATTKQENSTLSNTAEIKSDKKAVTSSTNIQPNLRENTLIVSESSGNVVLPYNISEINEILKKNPHEFSTVNDVISSKYTIPIVQYKNPFVARFREAYKLIRNKEKGTIKDAFDLGLELMFNYNLHPAIISACKNLDELDIYLDYLDNGETEKFNIFKVIFEIAPTVVKSKNEF